MAEGLGSRVGRGACDNLSDCYATLGQSDSGIKVLAQHDEAMQKLERARAMYEEVDDRTSLGRTGLSLGACFMLLRQFDKAINLLEQSRDICEENGYRKGLADACCNLAVCYMSLT
jgi:tetratricopeptide (TPR) repeat protein